MSCGGCIGTGEKVVNFAKAMARAAKAMLIGDPVYVTPERWKERLEICVACPHYLPPTDKTKPTCPLCGCPVKDKAWFATEPCPDNRWPAEQVDTPPIQG